MALLGFSCGLPLAMTALPLRQWLSEAGVTLFTIGLTSSIGLSYTLKFIWAPVLDRFDPPVAGRRRGWLMVTQALLIVAALSYSWSDPALTPTRLVGSAILIGFFSACQDIVVDAWRIETFTTDRERGLSLAIYIWGYRAALLVGGAGAVRLANDLGWHQAFTVMAALICVGVIGTGLASEPKAVQRPKHHGFIGGLRDSIVAPMQEFLKRQGAYEILAFVSLFKLGEAMAHTMAVPFYNSLGFDRVQIAYATGIPGLIASLLGAALGGWLIARVGFARALIITGFVQMASMGLYFALAVSHGDWRYLVAKIVVENIAEGMADAAFIAYLSSLCVRPFTATQYALLSSLAAIGLRTMGGLSGLLAGALGWAPFYALTILAAAPAMIIMMHLLRRFPHPPLEARQ